MNLVTLPQALYGLDGIREILTFKDNAILYKKLDYNLENNEKLITAHSVVYVLNGLVKICTLDGEEFVANNGEMLFVPRDSYLISDYLKHGQSMEVYLLFFDHSIVLDFLENISSNKEQSSICKLQVTDNIINYFKNLEQMHFKNPHNQKLLHIKLLEFLHLLSETDTFISTLQTSEQSKQKRDIDELMIQHYDKNISISEFAALSGRSLSSFNREFKRKHNTTPKKWLIKKKINKAQQLLKDGMSVTDTALEIGYMNVSNFIKTYKEIYGQTPKQHID
ncbi:MAG: AraC family transcriptional regulator [Sulfurovum sp.]|nr:AraC family transcriptional regulator [Sulfurovum sp.]MCB4764345.1 AraC family transcriptional regulator [Sulfurovum sp.]MCB4774815.1 AraC family transcriptional regulator [Sulfurovum sp.]